MVVEALPRRETRLRRSWRVEAAVGASGATVADDEFPRPTRPAGWPEVKLGLWWIVVAGFVAIFSAVFWALAWPEPRGFAALRIQIEFAIPLLLAWLGGLASVLAGLVGVLRQRGQAPLRRRQRRPLPRVT
jgi:hypothetical protein